MMRKMKKKFLLCSQILLFLLLLIPIIFINLDNLDNMSSQTHDEEETMLEGGERSLYHFRF
jgi:hypothetical protein